VDFLAENAEDFEEYLAQNSGDLKKYQRLTVLN
jgi:hypothetical protein